MCVCACVCARAYANAHACVFICAYTYHGVHTESKRQFAGDCSHPKCGIWDSLHQSYLYVSSAEPSPCAPPQYFTMKEIKGKQSLAASILEIILAGLKIPLAGSPSCLFI